MSQPLTFWQRPWAPLLLAVALLTRCPVPGWAHRGGPAIAQAFALFPWVGFGLGLVCGGAWILAQAAGVPPLVAAGLTIGLLCLLTGALHEDGLADCADGFGGGRDIAHKLEIMRDSRLGSYGVIALILSLVVRITALASLSPLTGAVALTVALVLGRTAMPAVMISLPPARTDGLGAGLGPAGRIAVTLALVGGISLATALLFPFALPALAALPAALLAALLIRTIARRQIGGFTGDVLGATEQLVQVTVLVVLAAVP